MRKNLINRQVLQRLGSLLALLAVAYMAWMFYGHFDRLDLSVFTQAMILLYVGLVVVYAMANALLAWAWWQILAHLNQAPSRFEAFSVFALSQIAKYLPGNLFHLAGRQVLGAAQGWNHKALLASSLWELSLLALLAASFTWLLLPNYVSVVTPIGALFGFLATLVTLYAVLRRWQGKNLAGTVAGYGLFLSISGMVFVLVVQQVSDLQWGLFEFSYVMAAFVTAWLLGLLTPGAPAGIGIREAALLWLLSGFLAPDEILLAVMLARLINILGDALFYVYFFLRK